MVAGSSPVGRPEPGLSGFFIFHPPPYPAMISLLETTRIKEAIERNPAHFEQIIEDTTLGVCVTDQNGLYVACNQVYQHITGYSREELIGQSFLMMVPKDNKAELQDLHDQFIQIQIEIFEKFHIINKSGQLIAIDVDAGFTDRIRGGGGHKLTFIQIA